MTIRTAVKVVALLAVYGAALLVALEVYSSYRYGNVRRITVSKLSDLDEVFEVGASGPTVRSPEFLKVFLAADYVYALKDAAQWFGSNETEFTSALEAAGGLADTFNDEGSSSIVLLSHRSAVILEPEQRTGFSVTATGCASAANDIEIRKSGSDVNGIEFHFQMQQ